MTGRKYNSNNNKNNHNNNHNYDNNNNNNNNNKKKTKPKNYRPITCLPTLYKILTSIIADRTYKHLEENEFCQRSRKGAKKDHIDAKISYLLTR